MRNQFPVISCRQSLVFYVRIRGPTGMSDLRIATATQAFCANLVAREKVPGIQHIVGSADRRGDNDDGVLDEQDHHRSGFATAF